MTDAFDQLFSGDTTKADEEPIPHKKVTPAANGHDSDDESVDGQSGKNGDDRDKEERKRTTSDEDEDDVKNIDLKNQFEILVSDDDEDRSNKAEKKDESTADKSERKEEEEEKEPEPTVSDEEYFKSVDDDEMTWYKENAPDHNKNIQCTSCFKAITPFINTASGVFRHPMLAVCMCKSCKNYYNDGEWNTDEDGCDMFCRWCGQGGDILICDKCPHAFCKKCLQRNLGRKALSEITKADEWKCLICDPKQIFTQKALYYALYVHQQELQSKRAAARESTTPRRKGFKNLGSIKKMEKAISSSGSAANFIDDTIVEAFKTLGVYQRALEEERKRWFKANRQLEPELALSITQKLKRIFSKSKTNMNLLDEALSIAFKEKFPELSKKIRIAKPSDGTVKKSSKISKTPEKIKRKILPKKKASSTLTSPEKPDDSKPGPKSAKPGPKSIKLAGPKSAKPGPKSAKSVSSSDDDSDNDDEKKAKKTPAKVSANLFFSGKKKNPLSAEIVKNDDSSDESDLDLTPAAKKRPRSPSPSPPPKASPAKKAAAEEPPAKKKRPGPKSKTQ